MGNLGDAGRAPRGPEVDEHPFARADKARQCGGLTGRIAERQLHVGLANFGILGCLDAPERLLHHGVRLHRLGEAGHALAALGGSELLHLGIGEEVDAQQVVEVGLDALADQSVELGLHGGSLQRVGLGTERIVLRLEGRHLFVEPVEAVVRRGTLGAVSGLGAGDGDVARLDEEHEHRRAELVGQYGYRRLAGLVADGEAAVLGHQRAAQLRAVAVGRHEEERVARRELHLAGERAGGAAATAQQGGRQKRKEGLFHLHGIV